MDSGPKSIKIIVRYEDKLLYFYLLGHVKAVMAGHVVGHWQNHGSRGW